MSRAQAADSRQVSTGALELLARELNRLAGEPVIRMKRSRGWDHAQMRAEIVKNWPADRETVTVGGNDSA